MVKTIKFYNGSDSRMMNENKEIPIVDDNVMSCKLELEGFDFSYALEVLQREDLVYILLKNFHDSIEPLQQKLADLLAGIGQENGVSAYRTEVHGLKSTAATIGALQLSERARELELAAIQGDVEQINVLHPILSEEMEKHKEQIATLFPEQEKELMADSRVIGYFDMLENSLLEEDYTVADFACEKIKQYQYAEELQTLVDALTVKILHLETEAALKILEKIKEVAGDFT